MNKKQDFKVLTGINIQWPWSELLASGQKSIETRSYPIPKRLKGVELAIIETPGKRGKEEAGFDKARIIGTITFSESKEYRSRKSWQSDMDKHLVQLDDPQFSFVLGRPKYGWIVERVQKLYRPVEPPAKRGIIFAKNCKVPKV